MIKNYYMLEEVPISSIKVDGWLKKFLKNQASGLTGHLEEAGFPFDSIGWDRYEIDTASINENPQWWVYEQTAYWVDGMERCGELLCDKDLLEKAEKSIKYVLDNAATDGFLGPNILKESDGWFRWPHVVFFRSLMAKYSATGDEQILKAITDFYLNSEFDYTHFRDVLNIEIMLWAYLNNGKIELLKLAEKTYSLYNKNCTDDNCVEAMKSSKKVYAHGVSYNEFCKLGAILYACTGNREYLEPVIKAYEKMERQQMLIDGCPCSNEYLINNHYMQSHETCVVTDYTWAMGYLLMATGDGKYADNIEKCVFNAGIGAVLEDFKALQYFSCPNQLILDNKSNHNDFFKGSEWMSYRPNPGTECCPGNVNRFFPNYCARMWMKKEGTIFSVLYGESNFSTVINGKKVNIGEKSDYPFRDNITFEFSTDSEVEFDFKFRIPAWCKNPSIKINGERYQGDIINGFMSAHRKFVNGDVIELELPSEVEIKSTGAYGVYVEKGPLLYCLGMKGERIVDKNDKKSSKEFPAYNIYPNKEWAYALVTDDAKKMNIKYHSIEEHPWNIDNSPITISAEVRKVNGWTFCHKKKITAIKRLILPLIKENLEGDFYFTPKLPPKKLLNGSNLGEKETIELVPYGLAKLRLTVFPKAFE